MRRFIVPSPSEPRKIEMFSPAFYAVCTVGALVRRIWLLLQLISSSVICRSIPWSIVAFLQDLVFCSRVWAPTVIGYSAQGAAKLYRGILPLWGRHIPYTMMKFASFETIVKLLYKHAIPTPKDQCSGPFQLAVSFGGWSVLCYCLNPADNLVSFLNNAKGATVSDAVKKLGLLVLFTRGLPLRVIMIGTLNWSTMKSLRCFQSFCWIVIYFFNILPILVFILHHLNL